MNLSIKEFIMRLLALTPPPKPTDNRVGIRLIFPDGKEICANLIDLPTYQGHWWDLTVKDWYTEGYSLVIKLA